MQRYWQAAVRQIPHLQVQPLHRGSGERPLERSPEWRRSALRWLQSGKPRGVAAIPSPLYGRPYSLSLTIPPLGRPGSQARSARTVLIASGAIRKIRIPDVASAPRLQRFMRCLGDAYDGWLRKLTIAPQIGAGRKFESRPVLRVFLTYANWSAEFRGLVGGIPYPPFLAALTILGGGITGLQAAANPYVVESGKPKMTPSRLDLTPTTTAYHRSRRSTHSAPRSRRSMEPCKRSEPFTELMVRIPIHGPVSVPGLTGPAGSGLEKLKGPSSLGR